MSNLKTYINQKNNFAEIFGTKVYDPNNLSLDDIQDLINKIECELSPENLHCNGEISRSQAQIKKGYLESVQLELQKLN